MKYVDIDNNQQIDYNGKTFYDKQHFRIHNGCNQSTKITYQRKIEDCFHNI